MQIFLRYCQKLCFLSLWIFFCSVPVKAQIIPDSTLPTPSIVTPSGSTQVVTGGTGLSQNLFHSFSQLSISDGGTVLFQHASNIENLLVRVTGNTASVINGTLQTQLINGSSTPSNVNLFLLNPSGITFGQNARLSLGGSFLASTADSIRFSNGSEFSARSPAAPLLTISAPIGLQFGNSPGKIDNRSVSTLDNQPLGLLLPEGKTLALIGGNLEMNGGLVSAIPGNLELAAVGSNASVSLDLATATFNFIDTNNLSDIVLTPNSGIQMTANSRLTLTGRNITLQPTAKVIALDSDGLIRINAENNLNIDGIPGADETRSSITSFNSVPTTGTGIQVNARNLVITGNGDISSITQGLGQGGNIDINVRDEIKIDGLGGGIFANSLDLGGSGNVTVNSRILQLQNGGQVNSINSQASSGPSGNISLKVSDRITLIGGTDSQSRTAISTQSNGSGRAGDLDIETKRLDLSNGAQIISSTSKSSNAGKISIKAQDVNLSGVGRTADGQFVLISGRRLSSAIGSDAQPNSTGAGADLNIDTDRFTLTDGAVIQSATFGSGDAGNIAINARQSITLQGRAPNPDDPFPSSILAYSGGIANENIFSVPSATGKGGSITLTTPQLKLTDGAQIALGSLNSTTAAQGAGDRLTINANLITLNNAKLNAATNAANGGNIDITANSLLLLRNGSKIITQAGIQDQGGNGGNINITSPFIFAIPSENSDINANAFTGSGGNVTLTTTSLLGLEVRPKATDRSDITASSQFGQQGTISINGPQVDPDRGTITLPDTPADPSKRIDQSCSADSPVASKFTVTGPGGLPATPQNSLPDASLARLARRSAIKAAHPTSPGALLQEAQSVEHLANGQTRLLAELPSDRASRFSDHCRR